MAELNDIEKLLQQIGTIVSINNEKERDRMKRGEKFNIFNTLGIQSEEVRLHSRFIAELLNPYGNHGMGGEFLSVFLTTIGKNSNFIDSSKVHKDSIIERSIGQNSATEGGRIDIIMEDGNNAIIIENKIYAGDQENQMLRYYNYAKKEFKSEEHFVLIYLTLDGHRPSKFSTHNEKFNPMCLSYGEDIVKWLNQCTQLAYNKPLVRETIVQYINLLKQLTKMDLDEEQIDKLAEIELSNIEAVITLVDYQYEISKHLREKYILEPLKKQFHTEPDSNGLKIFPSQWKNGFILLVIQKGEKVRIEIGLSEGPHKPITKLDCFECGPGEKFNPYGYSPLPQEFSNLNSPKSYTAMKKGRVLKWIEDMIEKIINEVNTKKIRL